MYKKRCAVSFTETAHLLFDPEHILRMRTERLDVDDYVVDFGDTPADVLLDLVGKGVGLGEGHTAVSLDIESNHVFASDAAGADTVRVTDAVDLADGIEDFLVDGDVLDTVHQLDVGVHEDLNRRADDKAAYEQRRD